jgi:DNA-directed RNA polymerase specialized sigma24 family protein
MWKVLGLLSALRDRPTESSLDSTTSEQPALKDVWDPVEQVEDDMLARELLAELPSLLSPFQLQVIHYIVLEEQSPRHVAALFNVAETRVRVEKSRALQKLRSHLSRQMPP